MRRGIKLIIMVLSAAVLPPSTVPDYSMSLRGLSCSSAFRLPEDPRLVPQLLCLIPISSFTEY